jgi:hypothetical protein
LRCSLITLYSPLRVRYKDDPEFTSASEADAEAILHFLLQPRKALERLWDYLTFADTTEVAHLILKLATRDAMFADALVNFASMRGSPLQYPPELIAFILNASGIEEQSTLERDYPDLAKKLSSKNVTFLSRGRLGTFDIPSPSQQDQVALFASDPRCRAVVDRGQELLAQVKSESEVKTELGDGRSTAEFTMSFEAQHLLEKFDGAFIGLMKALLEEIDRALQQVLRRPILTSYAKQVEAQRTTMELLSKATAHHVALLKNRFFRRKADVLKLIAQLVEFSHLAAELVDSVITITVSGGTSVGKTTFMESILGSRLPTTIDANTAMPLRLVHNPSKQKPVLYIPSYLAAILHQCCTLIRRSIEDLRASGIPHDIPKRSSASTDAVEIFDLIAQHNTSFQSAASFNASLIFAVEAQGENDIDQLVKRINGLVRLVYCLQASPRFRYRLPVEVVSFTKLYERFDKDDELLGALPTIVAYCGGVEVLPFAGQLNFIDTPGVTEQGGAGSFMEFTRSIMDRVFAASSRILVLTTPSQHGEQSTQDLLKKARGTSTSYDRSDIVTLVFNKFEQEQMPGENIDARFERYRRTYLELGIVDDVFRMRARAAHVATWGLRGLQRCGGLAAMMLPETRSHPDFETANNLLSEAFGPTWVVTTRHIPETLQQQILEAVLSRLRSDSQVDQVIISSVLRSLTRSVPEAGLKCVKRVSAILRRVSLEIKLRIASSESDEELCKQLPATIDIIARTAESVRHVPLFVNAMLIEVIDESVTEMLPDVHRRTRLSIDEVENRGPHKWPGTYRTEYYRVDGTDYGPFHTWSDVKYDNLHDAEKARDSATAKASSIVSDAVIEKHIEQERQRIFAEQMQSALTALKSEYNWSSRTTHTCAFEEAMAELQAILEREFSEVELSPVAPGSFNIPGLVYTTYESWWFFWRTYYSVVQFTGLRKLVEELLNRQYNSDFKRNLKARSNQKALEACDALATSLQGVVDQLKNIQRQVDDDRPRESPEDLKTLIENLSELQRRVDAVGKGLQENLAELKNQRSCVKQPALPSV